MNTAIRYQSRFGHTEQMAAIVSELTGAKAEKATAPLTEPVDTLYLGTGVFLGRIHSDVANFIQSLTPDKVKCVVLFGSCAIIESPVPQMRKALEARGIKVHEKSFTCRGSMGPIHSGHPDKKDMEELSAFVKSTLA